MTRETAEDAALRARVDALASSTPALAHLGIAVTHVSRGRVDLTLVPHTAVCQQDGFVHAGVMATLADAAAGLAAYTMYEPGENVLAVDFSINLLRPAVGDQIVARGTVIKPGRTLFTCEVHLTAIRDDDEALVARAVHTLFRQREQPNSGGPRSPTDRG